MTEPNQRETEYERSRRVDLDFPQPPMVPETEAERAAREPLFNRKKMFVWAALTFGLWFSFTQIVPVAIQAVKESVKESLAEASRPGVNPEIRTIILPNGKRITITKTGHGVTINESNPGEAVDRPEAVERPEPVERKEPTEAVERPEAGASAPTPAKPPTPATPPKPAKK